MESTLDVEYCSHGGVTAFSSSSFKSRSLFVIVGGHIAPVAAKCEGQFRGEFSETSLKRRMAGGLAQRATAESMGCFDGLNAKTDSRPS